MRLTDDPTGDHYSTPTRGYNARWCRFLQRDTLAPEGTDPYVCADDNPASNVDPSGRTLIWVLEPGLPRFFDPQGRYLFSLWASGNGAKQGTVVITNWGNYMMANGSLREQVRALVLKDAKERTSNGSWSFKGASSLGSNNYKTGYGLLHGANEKVGGFQISGYVQVTDLPDGCRKFTFFNKYNWYDIMDPNARYMTDTAYAWLVKKFAKNAADYNVRIYWEADCSVTINPAGEITDSTGWPFKLPFSLEPVTPSTPGIPCDPWCNVG